MTCRPDPVYSETYKGCRIEIFYDEDRINPFEDWDGEPPIAVAASRSNVTEYATQYGHANQVPTLSGEQIKANWKEIKPMLELESIFALRVEIEYAGNITDAVNDLLRKYVDGLAFDSDRLEALQIIFRMCGMACVVKSVYGSSQGEYAEVLAVSTPQYLEAIGQIDTDQQIKNLEYAVQLYADYAFGNVYGYTVSTADGERLDSCFGFFGDYDAEYGALSQAKESIDAYVEDERKKRLLRIKTFIRNHVPLYIRQRELTN